MKLLKIKKAGRIVAKAVSSFVADNCFQYSAAISFYTLFSIAPTVIIAVYITGLFFGNESAMAEFENFLATNMGQESAEGVMLLVDTVQTNTDNVLYLIISLLFLFIMATTIFIQFKQSFNQIFQVRALPDTAVIKVFRDRFLAFGMVLLLGVAMILSLMLDAILVAIVNFFPAGPDPDQIIIVGLIGNVFSFLIILIAIVAMFYLLPDVRIQRKPLLYGSLVTTILLVVGKFAVGLIIGNSSLNELSGASSSIIILMLWIYYSGIIIFFGIELVKAIVKVTDGEIEAGKFAQKMNLTEADKDQG